VDRPPLIEAGGAVVWRRGDRGVEVVLIHRPKYDDWSFPKGKLDPGEHVLAATVREVAEETGLEVHLGAPVGNHTYPVTDGIKQVHYWSARHTCDGDVDAYRPNHEVDDVAWVPIAKARKRLSYGHDAQILEEFLASPFRARPLIVLRHARARARASWQREDSTRPLADPGRRQAQALVPLLAAYGIQRVLTSDAVRCAATVEPFAREALVEVERDHRLSEDDGADLVSVRRSIRTLLKGKARAVVCSHRPVLPEIFAAVGLEDPKLKPGGFVVLHHRGGKVKATEQHMV